MPTPFIQKLSEEKKIPVSVVEGFWDEAKSITENKFRKKEKEFTSQQWAYVTAITKRKVNSKRKKGDMSLGRDVALSIMN